MSKPLSTAEILKKYRASCAGSKALALRALNSGTLPPEVRGDLTTAVSTHGLDVSAASRFIRLEAEARRERARKRKEG